MVSRKSFPRRRTALRFRPRWHASHWLLAALFLAAFSPPGPVSLGAQAPAPAEDRPTVETVETQITRLEASTDLDEGIKGKALESYRTALKHLKDARSYAANLATYRELVNSGPEEVKGIREKLNTPPPDPNSAVTELEFRPIGEVEGELTKEQARLTSIQSSLSELATQIQAQETRPARIREEVAQAKERLQQVETELKAPVEEGNVVLREARSTLLLARKHARTTEIQMLEQETVVYQTRLDLMTARRQLDQREASQLEARVKLLRDLVGRKRRAEAERARAEAERAREAARGKHPLLVELAEQNAVLSKEFADLTRRTENASRTHQQIVADLKTVDEEHKSARSKLERVGLSGMLGEIFVERRRNMPSLDRYRRATTEHRGQMGVVRLGQLDVDERRRRLADLAGALAEITGRAEGTLEEDELEDFRSEARALLQDQAGLLEKLDTAYGRYLRVLVDLDIDQRELEGSLRRYRAFLDDHLLWTPSAPPLGPSTLGNLGRALKWFLAPKNWREALASALDGLMAHPVLSVFGFVALFALVLSRWWVRGRLGAVAERVGRKHSDSFVLTLYALLLTLFLAAPLPVLLWLLAQLLSSTSSAPEFPWGLGVSFAWVALFLLVLQGIRLLCVENGVVDAHFRWRPHTRVLIRRSTLWLMALGLPAVFVVALTEAHENEVVRNSLGRLSFMVGMLAVAAFAGRVLSPRSGILQAKMAAEPESWLSRLRYLWYPVACGVPLAIAAMAGGGYYYTAIELHHCVVASVLIILGAVFLYSLIVRWLVIARTRLAIARARERREAALAAREVTVEDEEPAPDLEIPEIDLATIKEQTHHLFRTAIILVVLASLLGIWAHVLPALSVVDRELWQSKVIVAGEEHVRSITIASVLFAGLLVILGFVCARNLPGFLEVAILRKLSVDPGSRYAVATIGQYLMVSLGLVLAFRTLGVAWSHVQWLIAALSVGLGFGLQEIFANFVSGLIILLERPIRVGDTVTIGEISGTVTRIRIRATTITDWDQKELVVPNKSFITGQLVNWSLSSPVTRLIVKVGIAYGSDTELALRLMLQAARENPRLLADPEPTVFFVGFGDSALNFEVRVFVKELSNRGRTRIVHELHMAIDKYFREHGVVIAFPQRDIHIKSDERLRDGVPRFSGEFGADLE